MTDREPADNSAELAYKNILDPKLGGLVAERMCAVLALEQPDDVKRSKFIASTKMFIAKFFTTTVAKDKAELLRFGIRLMEAARYELVLEDQVMITSREGKTGKNIGVITFTFDITAQGYKTMAGVCDDIAIIDTIVVYQDDELTHPAWRYDKEYGKYVCDFNHEPVNSKTNDMPITAYVVFEEALNSGTKTGVYCLRAEQISRSKTARVNKQESSLWEKKNALDAMLVKTAIKRWGEQSGILQRYRQALLTEDSRYSDIAEDFKDILPNTASITNEDYVDEEEAPEPSPPVQVDKPKPKPTAKKPAAKKTPTTTKKGEDDDKDLEF